MAVESYLNMSTVVHEQSSRELVPSMLSHKVQIPLTERR